jgi:hypothetical protein
MQLSPELLWESTIVTLPERSSLESRSSFKGEQSIVGDEKRWFHFEVTQHFNAQ